MITFQTKFYVKYLGESDSLSFIKGWIYSVVETENEGEFYRIIDETDGDYLCSKSQFEVMQKEQLSEFEIKKAEKHVKTCNDYIKKYGYGNF